MSSIRVHTAQNVTLEYQVASIGDRIVATLIDWLVLGAWGAVWGGIFYLLAKFSSDGTSAASTGYDWSWSDPVSWIVGLLLAVIIAPFLFYPLASEVLLNGQSIGKKARHIRVVRLDGTSPRLGNYLLRWLLRPLDMFFYGAVGMITIAANGRGQRLGDLAAGTSVVSLNPKQAAALPDPATLAPPVGYQPVFPQAAQLSDHDVSLLHQLLDRSLRQNNYELLHETAQKIKSILTLQTDLDDVAFLRTVLRDHYYLVHEEPALR